jgi:hypothetical protein
MSGREGLEDSEGRPVGVIGAVPRSAEGSRDKVGWIEYEERAHKTNGAP